MAEICVLGLGYIGLPTALLFATNNNNVIGIDINPKIINSLKKGKIHFEEKGLQELLDKALEINSFKVYNEMRSAEVYIVCVPTPLNKKFHMAELKYVEMACNMILPHLKKDDLVIIESTISPGSSENLFAKILEKSGLRAGKDFNLVHCPERAIPGNTLFEIINNYRIIGGLSEKGAKKAKTLYLSFVKEEKIKLTDIRTAEIVKLMENSYRDINIALANEFALISEDLGINAWEAIELANLHPRVNILRPGPGVGGHCIAIDPWFLTETTLNTKIIQTARSINDTMPNFTFQILKQLLSKEIHFPTITVLGVAYKANVDDSRETPAMKFIHLAKNHGMNVKVFDPFCKDFKTENGTSNEDNLEAAVKDSDCLVLITDHDVFKDIDPKEIAPLMKNKYLLDARNHLDHQKWLEAGFEIRILGFRGKTL